MFCEESLGKINAKDFEPERFRSRILSLESVDYFGTNEYFSGRKKENLNEKNSDGEAPVGGTLGFSGWGCAAGTLEPLTYTRANSAEFCYPILE